MKKLFQTFAILVILCVSNHSTATKWSQESISEFSTSINLISKAVITEVKSIHQNIKGEYLNCGLVVTAKANRVYKGALSIDDTFSFYIDSDSLKIGKEYLIFTKSNVSENKAVSFLKHSNSMDRQKNVYTHCEKLIGKYDWVVPSTLSEIITVLKKEKPITWIQRPEYFIYPEEAKFGQIRFKIKSIDVNDKDVTRTYWGDLPLPIINEFKVWYDFYLWEDYEEHLISSLK